MSRQKLVQKQYQALSPQQIQFLGLLQIPITSLEKKIEDELEENPLLEEDEVEEHEGDSRLTKFESHKRKSYEDVQIEESSNSLENHLQKQLVDLNVNERERFLINYLINSLDKSGFLNRDLYSICGDIMLAEDFEVTETELEKALKKLQSLEPTGVGAKDLKECLLLQLKKSYPEEVFVQKIVSEHYTQFSNKNFEFFIKKNSLTEDQVKHAYNLIEGLNPIPSSGFYNNNHTKYIYPDFSIVLQNNKPLVQLNNKNVKPLKINKFYRELFEKTKEEETKKFLKNKLEKAEWFKNAINNRANTLNLVMQEIVSIQERYFVSGLEKDLKPMKLADVAKAVKMDISTISRVSNSKFIETNFGTFKVKELFSEAYTKLSGEVVSTKEIKKELKNLINNEDKQKPYTDEKLAELLGKNNYHIARRTVTKYREQLNLETARLRRQL